VRKRAEHHRCDICGTLTNDAIQLATVRPSLAIRLTKAHPNLTTDSFICRAHVVSERTYYVQELLEHERSDLSDLDRQVVASLAKEETITRDVEQSWEIERSLGERISDFVANFGGSWTFIALFFIGLFCWIGYNLLTAPWGNFDPYPFILLNLLLSCVAAVQAPIIMMSQNRQEAKDRLRAQNDYKVNLKAELEIRHLHEKLDHLINRQWERLAEIQQIQLEIMEDLASRSSR